tara:strand:- start:165 stop:872 length:708 start_codon:yes stop_codon:yes gene_type:complete
MKFGSITTGIIADGLVFNTDPANRACYPKTGTTATDTIGFINGTLTNGTTFSNDNEGIFGFDGTDDYIDFGDVLDFDRFNPFSIGCWFKRNRSGTSEFLVAKQESSGNYRGYTFLLPDDDNKLTIVFRHNAAGYGRLIVDGATAITDTNWHYGVVTYDGSSVTAGIKIYLDGLDNTGSVTGTLSSTTVNSIPLQIGARNNGNCFDGNIASTHIYNRELSSSEVLHNYNALKSRFE